jgi:hypothetical protein
VSFGYVSELSFLLYSVFSDELVALVVFAACAGAATTPVTTSPAVSATASSFFKFSPCVETLCDYRSLECCPCSPGVVW